MASLSELEDEVLLQLEDEVLQTPADVESSRLQEQIECDVRTLEEMMLKRLGPLPTPPLSPERDDKSPTDTPTYVANEFCTSESDVALLSDIQLLIALEDECMSSDSQNSVDLDLEEKLISQDCPMWGSFSYEPRCSSTSNSDGIYTPAPSPPPSTRATDSTSTLESMEEESSSSEDNSQPECISPQDVFPVLLPCQPANSIACSKVSKSVGSRSKMTLRHPAVTKRWSVSNPRMHSHGGATTTSESEEEIDVVTVPDRGERPSFKMTTRKRVVSLSAPVSRQTSPSPSSSPGKRRRYHAKRLQRLNSSGDNGADSDDDQRRASHNVLEKKRRNDLKYSFQVLRSQIPELEENQRAPKVVILRKATEFIRQMQKQDSQLEKEFKREILRKEKLVERLKHLKSLPQSC